MSRLILGLLSLICMHISSQLKAQTWNMILEPSNSNAAFKRHGYFENGTGWTMDEYSRFQVIKLTNDGVKNWEQINSPNPTNFETIQDLYSRTSSEILAIMSNTYKNNFTVSKFDIAKKEWEVLGTHPVPNVTIIPIGANSIWAKYISDNLIYGTVYGQDENSNIQHFPFIIRNGGKDLEMLRDNLTDDFKNLVDLEFYDEKIGLMITRIKSNYTLFKTTDGGKTWSNEGSIDGHEETDIQMPSKDVFYIGLETELLKSVDGGKTWTNEAAHDDMVKIEELVFANEDCGIAINRTGNGSNYIYKTTNGGKNWTEHEVSKDVPEYSDGTIIYEVKYINCDTWFAITSRHVISTGSLPFSKSVSISKAKDKKATFYPNPVSNTLNFNTLSSIKIFNLSGQLMHQSNQVSTINIADLKPGMYILETVQNNQVFRQKFIKE